MYSKLPLARASLRCKCAPRHTELVSAAAFIPSVLCIHRVLPSQDPPCALPMAWTASNFSNIDAFLSVTPPCPASPFQTELNSLFPDMSPLSCCTTLFKSELDPITSLFEKKNVVSFRLLWTPSINFQTLYRGR